MLKLIDGKQLAQKRREEIRQTVEQLKSRGIVPGLAVILVGEDPASQVYVRNKEKACRRSASIRRSIVCRRRPARRNYCS